ncbi:NXPE family member 3-like [Amphiura filiformis]|uniref:NXPE family member 3-like n=1 Tax=Amphiura filiformis TaxID=82378 RepID=UPI003B21BF8E
MNGEKTATDIKAPYSGPKRLFVLNLFCLITMAGLTYISSVMYIKPAHVSYTITSVKQYQLCDTLDITIDTRGSENERKHGDDYLWVWVDNRDLNASAVADEIIDHQNGIYTARFQLHWTGRVNIAVNLIQYREEVTTLVRVRDTYPARCSYQGKFEFMNMSLTTSCHFTQDMYFLPTEKSINNTFCNFTDDKTGFPWYCVKPDGLSCDSYVAHAVAPHCGTPLIRSPRLTNEEKQLFQRLKSVKSVSAETTFIDVEPTKSKEVTTLVRVRDTYPARCSYQGKFEFMNMSLTTSCHFTQDMYFLPTEKSINNTFCNFTDDKTGFPWYCVKPDGLSCDSYVAHAVAPHCGTPLIRSPRLTNEEKQLFQRLKSVKSVSAETTFIDVEPTKSKETSALCRTIDLPPCSQGLKPRPMNSTTGFYYQDQWYSLVCKNRKFATTDTRKCLQNQRLYFWGDSTLRQWYEYFAAVMNTTLVEKKAENIKFGPHLAVDNTYNIRLYYRHHGFPIRNNWTDVEDIHYVPNMIDDLPNSHNQVVLLSLWAHFTASSLEYYSQRWQQIKQSVLRLKSRDPGARIIIKSANTRELAANIDALSWYSNQLDNIMREIMMGVEGVIIIDVWDMTIGHRTGFRIHPEREIISQEVDMLLSFLCPEVD